MDLSFLDGEDDFDEDVSRSPLHTQVHVCVCVYVCVCVCVSECMCLCMRPLIMFTKLRLLIVCVVELGIILYFITTQCLLHLTLYHIITSLPFLPSRVCGCSCALQISPSRKHKSSSSNGRKSSKGQGAKKAAKVRYVTCSPYVTLVTLRRPILLIHPDLYLVIYYCVATSIYSVPTPRLTSTESFDL